MNDGCYSGFDTYLDAFKTKSPKLGEVFPEDLQILNDIKNKNRFKVFDCGVNIA